VEYLAYGSNMLSAWLQSRVPCAANPRVVALPGRTVLYRKLSHKDGSSKCDLALAPDSGIMAYGVVFDIDSSDQRALDAAEGRGYGYHRVTLEAVYEGQVLRPFVYLADESALVHGLPPHDWYRDLVVAGAREHGLPTQYVASLADVPVTVDPSSARAAEARSLIPAEWRDQRAHGVDRAER
jgi:gamma-glutamylcyclotransferase